MDDISIYVMLFIIAGSFLAGFVDSIAGGGGLISLPVLLAAGMPPNLAIGTNKFSATFGILMSSYQFYKARKIDYALVRRVIPFTAVGAVLGVLLVLHLSPEILKPVVILTLMISAAFVILKKDWGQVSTYDGLTTKVLVQWSLGAFAIGIYDGFIGPGTGTFLIIGFVLTGFDFVIAAGNAKILNMVSNVVSFVLFVYWDQVLYVYGIAMAVSMFFGAYFGSRLAIRKGSRFVRIIFIVITITLIGKLALNYIGLL